VKDIEGEYVRLSKKDLIDRLDMKYAENKDNMGGEYRYYCF
jgi:hypothetical protein